MTKIQKLRRREGKCIKCGKAPKPRPSDGKPGRLCRKHAAENVAAVAKYYSVWERPSR